MASRGALTVFIVLLWTACSSDDAKIGAGDSGSTGTGGSAGVTGTGGAAGQDASLGGNSGSAGAPAGGGSGGGVAGTAGSSGSGGTSTGGVDSGSGGAGAGGVDSGSGGTSTGGVDSGSGGSTSDAGDGGVCILPCPTGNCVGGVCYGNACAGVLPPAPELPKVACVKQRGNCNGDLNDGCETDLANSSAHCGSCGNACSSGYCSNGVCAVLSLPNGAGCPAKHFDCDLNTGNGCEVDISNDPQNCGGCLLKCPAVTDGTATCVNGTCRATCNAGFANCNSPSTCTPITNDPWNCGGCGHECGLAGCNDGSCSAPPVPLVTLTNVLAGVRVVGSSLYYTSGGALLRIPVNGGCAETLASQQGTVGEIAADPQYVYFLAGTSIRRVPIAGGAASTAATVASGTTYFAVNSSYLYWSDPAGYVWRAPKGGGAAQAIATAVDPRGIAANDQYVYWNDYGVFTVRRMSVGGGVPEDFVVQAGPRPYRLALDSNTLAWTNRLYGGFSWTSLDKSSKHQFASNAFEYIALNSSSVYATGNTSGQKPFGGLLRSKKDGTGQVSLSHWIVNQPVAADDSGAFTQCGSAICKFAP